MTNEEIRKYNLDKALECQEKWRQKQIYTLYIQGRPIFQANRCVKRSIKKMGYEIKKIPIL